ncbi:multidrug effflux MFS transporter [Pseudovibrio sp. Tun.PSC04-5.I4]|uniref:multidrug effflux MFS transporter n=1 Tax=Pseudovibrio sp. Tun.PSC04-5.I4 TaxID=1798213 RepID=UPI00088AA324|nr:multidrug effflux MFS transporter [Pseudovibrio sp. Tun.PSC04-5.I4]SDR34387.1 MFS transporter, DHA1 family, bicyclomycin/chloramphenicol resistance protein [Pseudovibrio sp. Tun.PSC04-5.I4]
MSAVTPLQHERVPHPGLSLLEIVTLVAALMALNAVATSMMLPALPAMSEALNVASNDRQLVITAYMVGLACASLFFGPLSDSIGRRTTLVIGLSLYIIGGIYSTFAVSFEQMLVARAIQGIGAAAPRVASISMIRDWYSGRQMGKVMSLVMVAFQIAPVVAPFLGQIVLLFAPWQGVFAALTLFGVLVLVWCLFRLPESLDPANQRPLKLRSIMSAYKLALTTRVTVGYMLAMSFIFACLFAFINSAQQVFMERFELAELFPVVFAAISISMAASSYLNSKMVEKYGLRRMSHMALLGFTATSLLMVAIAYNSTLSVALFIAVQSLAMFFFGFIGPNFNTMAMEPLGRVAGAGSAVIGFVTTLIGALLGAGVGKLYDGTELPLVYGVALFSIMGLICVLITENGRLFKPQHEQQLAAE